MLGKLRMMLLILALGLSAVSCSGTFRIGVGSTPTPAATRKTEAHATLQAAVEATLTAVVVESTAVAGPTEGVEGVGVEASAQGALDATVPAHESPVVPEPTPALPTSSEFPSLVFSTYLGGSDSDNVRDLAVDGEGNLYIVGMTSSPDLPTTPGAHDASYNGDTDAFFAKLSPDGSTLLYSTYLGGSGYDGAEAIAVDDEGNVYVAGNTYSTDFPTTPGALDSSLNGGRDVFIAKLTPAGDDLVYSTYLGGDSWEYGIDITVDGSGDAYVAGFTRGDFPTTPGAFQTTFGGAWDGYVAKLNMDGSALLYSTYLGGTGGDFVSGIAVDETGKLYVTGGAASTDFPTTPDAWDRVCDNCQTDMSEDGFVAKLNTDGSDLIYSTLIGGNATPAYPERFDSIAIDDAGNAYVAGRTAANDFPTTTGAFQTGFGGGSRDAILVKLNPGGSSLLYSTYLGGSGTDDAYKIVIDSMGNAYVTGRSTSTNLPTVNSLQATNGGGYDAFVAKVNTDGSTLLYSTYFGGSADENSYGGEPHHLAGNIALDATGSIYFIGTTRSQDFPTANALLTDFGGGDYDAFVTKLTPDDVPPSLLYSTYLGGGDSDNVRDLAVDGEGNVYIVETTSSPDLPTTPGAHDASYNGDMDAFVAKLSPDGSTLLYSTYLGGSSEDRGDAIAVDDEGSVYVTGHTYSTDFPTSPGALDGSLNGGRDVFVAKLSPAGDHLVYSTYLGGDNWDYGHCIAIGDDGSAYVGGFTHGGFPVTPGAAQTTFGGSGDGFVVRLSPDGTSMIYSTYLGGWSWEGIAGIAVDLGGNAYLATHTHSSDFPTTPGAYDRVCDNCRTNVSTDAAAAKLSADGSQFIYSTLVGGADPNCGEAFRDIAVDPAGNAYLVGQSCSVDFPTTPGALQESFHGGQYDVVVTKLNADGSELLYSTYLGGAGTDTGQAIAIDAEGNAYVSGPTDSLDFPTAFPLQPATGGKRDAFIVQLNPDASRLLFSTYFGGSGNEFDDPVNTGIGFDFTSGGFYLAAGTSSADLPTTTVAYDVSYNGGGYDGFVALLNSLTGPGVAPAAAPEPAAAPIAEPTVALPPTAVDLLVQVTSAGRLVVSTDPNYAPQSFINDNGELDGFDVEVAKEVAGRLGVEVEFVTPDWDMITGGNWGARWDLSIGSMKPTESRAQVLWFTDPYYYIPASFAVYKDNTTITEPGDLAGKKVGLGTATAYEAYLGSSPSMMGGEIMYGPPAGIHVVSYTTDAEAIQDLALGDGVRLDAVLSAQQIFQSAITSGVPLKIVPTPAFYEPLVFALDQSRGASDQMLLRLNEIIAEMHADGTLSALSTDWYGIDLTTVIEPGE